MAQGQNFEEDMNNTVAANGTVEVTQLQRDIEAAK